MEIGRGCKPPAWWLQQDRYGGLKETADIAGLALVRRRSERGTVRRAPPSRM